jgi:GT2 family glycosyltransferase
MNGILTLTRNNLALTQRAIHSFLRQDIPVVVKAIDNGSTDGTRQWLEAYGWLLRANSSNVGVSAGWNDGILWFFENGADNVLVMGNDTCLPPYFYRELLSYDFPFITGVAVENMAQIQPIPNKCPLDPHPDFSAFCMRRGIWRDVGFFDERMKHYASDCDWHIRAHRKLWKLWKASCEFYHERSSTLRNAKPDDAREIQEQANKDRAMFHSLYNCLPGDQAYEQIFLQNPSSQTVPSLESSDNTLRTGT